MLLTIRTLSCPPPDNPQSIHAQFGAAGGRIGRSPPCTLILPDPNRHISREHAEIRCRDNVFSIKVVSKVNSVMVNDTLVGPGEAAPLSSGDQILIGEYLMQVEIVQAAVAAAPMVASPFASPAARPAAGSPFDVFDSLAPPPPASPAALAPDWFQAPAAKTAPPPSTTNLDDFFNPQPAATKLGEVLITGSPSTSTPEPLFAPPPPAAPLDTRLDQFLGLHDPFAADAAVGLSQGSQDLYRASPMNLPLHATAVPSVPAPPPLSASPVAHPSHDDIFKALEQDFGALGGASQTPVAPPVAFAPPPLAAPSATPPPYAAPPLAPVRPLEPSPSLGVVPPSRPVADPSPAVPAFPLPPAEFDVRAPVAVSIPDPVLAAPNPPTPGLPRAAVAPGPMPAAHASPPVDAGLAMAPAALPVGMPRAVPMETAAYLDPTPSGVGRAAFTAPMNAAAASNGLGPELPSASGTAEVQRLMLVLCEALGLEPRDMDLSDPERTLRLVGELLRMSTDGLFRLLEMRSQVKSELHIEDRTMIASRENNPLKHADTPRDAITYLVDLRQHGNKLFMPPVKAVEDTIWDICAHEMAVMAGTREALLAAMKMFAPETIEGRIKKTGALENVLPALHKSRLWERFVGMHAELQQAAKEDFDRLLNQEFAKAYSEQSKKLKKKR